MQREPGILVIGSCGRRWRGCNGLTYATEEKEFLPLVSILTPSYSHDIATILCLCKRAEVIKLHD